MFKIKLFLSVAWYVLQVRLTVPRWSEIMHIVIPWKGCQHFPVSISTCCSSLTRILPVILKLTFKIPNYMEVFQNVYQVICWLVKNHLFFIYIIFKPNYFIRDTPINIKYGHDNIIKN